MPVAHEKRKGSESVLTARDAEAATATSMSLEALAPKRRRRYVLFDDGGCPAAEGDGDDADDAADDTDVEDLARQVEAAVHVSPHAVPAAQGDADAGHMPYIL